MVDLGADVPAHDVPLIAPITSLVAREGTHPALEQLLLQAANRIHGGAGWISCAGRFPTAQHSEFPLAAEAERYYANGPPLLQRYLPFWLANLIDRMWVVLITIIAVVIPLSRVIPPLYRFRIRRRVFRWYRQLRDIEEQLAIGAAKTLRNSIRKSRTSLCHCPTQKRFTTCANTSPWSDAACSTSANASQAIGGSLRYRPGGKHRGSRPYATALTRDTIR